MLHPHTEMKYVSPEIGHGIFATKRIPKGTVTWIKDELDRVFTQKQVDSLTPANYENLMKYTYRNNQGDYFFCWDLTRYVNHSFVPNSMLTALGFEVAIRDIEIGEEMTNDYGTFNILEEFKCAKGSHKGREFVRPDDLKRFYTHWDQEISGAMESFNEVDQPLKKFMTPEQDDLLNSLRLGEKKMPSVLENFYEAIR